VKTERGDGEAPDHTVAPAEVLRSKRGEKGRVGAGPLYDDLEPRLMIGLLIGGRQRDEEGIRRNKGGQPVRSRTPLIL